MKSTVLQLLLVGVLVLGLCSSAVHAQSSEANRTKTRAGKTVTVTGCLHKGDERDEYSITSADGKTYGLRSTTVKLADHLNHKVTVTGQTVKAENEKEEQEKAGNQAEAADLLVTNLKMISTSCQ